MKMKKNDYGVAIRVDGKWRMFGGVGCYSESYAKKIYAKLIRESRIIGDVLKVASASSKEVKNS